MNTGTILRTILVAATCINTALMATDVTEFNSPALDFIYKVASVILNFIIVGIATYFNQDYSEEACEGTGRTRWLKAVKKGQTLGDGLQDEPETEEEEDNLGGEFFE